MNVSDYAACDACELSRLIADGRVSAEEVRTAALLAIKQVDGDLNAVVHGPFEDARGGDGPLAGVPFGIKDTLFERGRPCEFGSRLLAGFIAPVDATLAERFRAAGLMGLVRTATPEFAFSPDTSPLVNGPTLNPWALDRSAGGSSGGSAALVAARALPAAHGNDGGGSIRIPAAWCGLVGLKPSRGRVPPGPFIGESPGGIAHEFALTRTVRDAAALLDAVAGPAPGDRYYVARPARPFREELAHEPAPLRIALHTQSFWGAATDPGVKEAVEAAGAQLESLGHYVEPAAPSVDAEAFAHAHLVLWCWLLSQLATALGALVGRPPEPSNVEAASLACIRRGLELTAADIASAYAIQNAASRVWGTFLDGYDVFLCPTTPTGPPPAGTPPQNDSAYTDAESWLDDVFGRIPYTPVANTTGQPSISLPLGTAYDGLPIGVMLTAQTLREDVLLRLAGQLERAVPWGDRMPPVAAR